ncbi:MAG TPA: G1 family glutamic endopeptidase [Acidimicrobiia bacterium]|nr:G1 family glutamic endopeptidase [Acidimicrobiia bacterium]
MLKVDIAWTMNVRLFDVGDVADAREGGRMRRLVFVMVLALTGLVAPSAAVGAPMLVHEPAHISVLSRGTEYSTNWSGYADQGATFTDVRAAWTQPAVTCPSRQRQYASFWVGLDGYASNSVEQIGTDSDCAGRNEPVYYAWYEMYPAGSVSLSSSRYPVAVGDSMAAEVSASGTTFTLTLHDTTRGWTYKTAKTSSAAQKSSAEWVAEAPSSCYWTCTVLPLANFNAMSFTASSTVGNGQSGTISTFENSEIVMVTNGGTVKAQPSTLTNGNAFSDTWQHS